MELAKGMGATVEGLICPNCKSENLHHGELTVFSRGAEDDPSGVITRVDIAAAVTTDLHADMKLNPSSRRGGILIDFTCEGCEAAPTLAIVQHKGTTYVYWQSMRVSW